MPEMKSRVIVFVVVLMMVVVGAAWHRLMTPPPFIEPTCYVVTPALTWAQIERVIINCPIGGRVFFKGTFTSEPRPGCECPGEDQGTVDVRGIRYRRITCGCDATGQPLQVGTP